jgi:hypothetical protein
MEHRAQNSSPQDSHITLHDEHANLVQNVHRWADTASVMVFSHNKHASSTAMGSFPPQLWLCPVAAADDDDDDGGGSSLAYSFTSESRQKYSRSWLDGGAGAFACLAVSSAISLLLLLLLLLLLRPPLPPLH